MSLKKIETKKELASMFEDKLKQKFTSLVFIYVSLFLPFKKVFAFQRLQIQLEQTGGQWVIY